MLCIEKLASADDFCPFVLGDLASFDAIYRHLIKFFEKVTLSCVVTSSVPPSAWNNSPPTGRIFIKFGT
jgi:hypothetical protein